MSFVTRLLYDGRGILLSALFGQVDVSFMPFRSHICPVDEGDRRFLLCFNSEFGNDVRVGHGRHSTRAIEE